MEMLRKFGLKDSKPTKTPMSTEIKLTKDDEADSMVALNIKTTHLEAVKCIFRSLNKKIEDGIFFNQSKYVMEMLRKFGLKDSKPTKTPMPTEIKLTKDDEADSMVALNIK
nr:putative ribonuclease H-like domain-containing protein [Tanacetum cinerariifolium]